MKYTDQRDCHSKKDSREGGSLTVEAALVLPVFIFLVTVFLYFIQIFILQEQIQRIITKAGLSLAKVAYVYDDLINRIDDFDLDLFGEEDIGISDLVHTSLDGTLVKAIVKKDLDTDQINNSCILDGYDGISFYNTRVLDEEDCIDIIVRYRIRIPIRIFAIKDMRTTQRVRLRGWTGHKVAKAYTEVEEDHNTGDNIVYITETGTVFHRSISCSHIKLSIKKITGKPIFERNQSGGIYYPCETCCRGELSDSGTYYITDTGTRYHIKQDCSGIKRTVQEVPFSEVSERSPCKRCGIQ